MAYPDTVGDLIKYTAAHSTWPVWSRGGVHGGAQDADRASTTRGRCMHMRPAAARRNCTTAGPAGKEEDHHAMGSKKKRSMAGLEKMRTPIRFRPIGLVRALIACVGNRLCNQWYPSTLCVLASLSGLV